MRAILVAMALCGGPPAAPAGAQVDPGPVCTPIESNKLRLRKVDDLGLGNERILFRGVFATAPGVPLDPAGGGVRFQMLDASGGAALVDIALPGIAFGVDRFGWLANASGTVWNWRDPDEDVSGLKRLVMKRATPSGAVRVSLFGQDLGYPVPVTPITVRVLVNAADGSVAACGEVVFANDDCFFRNQGNKLTCRTEGGRNPQ